MNIIVNAFELNLQKLVMYSKTLVTPSNNLSLSFSLVCLGEPVDAQIKFLLNNFGNTCVNLVSIKTKLLYWKYNCNIYIHNS